MPCTIVRYRTGVSFRNKIYLDANFLIYSRNRRSNKFKPARELLVNLLTQRINLFITNLVIDEVCWTLLRQYYKNDTGQPLDASMVKTNPSIVLPRYYNRVSLVVSQILRFNRLVVASDQINSRELIHEAISLMSSESLMPRDSFHLAFINKLNIDGFVTSDNDFDHLTLPSKNLIVYKF